MKLFRINKITDLNAGWQCKAWYIPCQCLTNIQHSHGTINMPELCTLLCWCMSNTCMVSTKHHHYVILQYLNRVISKWAGDEQQSKHRFYLRNTGNLHNKEIIINQPKLKLWLMLHGIQLDSLACLLLWYCYEPGTSIRFG